MTGAVDPWLDFVENISGKADGTWYFRGQKNAAWSLIPNIARPDVCGPLGYSVSEEKSLLQRFRDEAVMFIKEDFQTIEWLALAQHHGLPTRLLDWSSNPLTAAWFACQDESNTHDVAIHMIRHRKSDVETSRDFNPFAAHLTEIVLLKVPPRVARITAQQGLFTCHSTPNQAWTFTVGTPTGVLDYEKFLIPAGHTAFFRSILNILGVNQSRHG